MVNNLEKKMIISGKETPEDEKTKSEGIIHKKTEEFDKEELRSLIEDAELSPEETQETVKNLDKGLAECKKQESYIEKFKNGFIQVLKDNGYEVVIGNDGEPRIEKLEHSLLDDELSGTLVGKIRDFFAKHKILKAAIIGTCMGVCLAASKKAHGEEIDSYNEQNIITAEYEYCAPSIEGLGLNNEELSLEIEKIHEDIEKSKNETGRIYHDYNAETGNTESNIDVEKMQQLVDKKGSLQLVVKNYSSIEEGRLAEDISVYAYQLDNVEQSVMSDLQMEGNLLTFSVSADTPETALSMAINQAAENLETIISSKTVVEGGFLDEATIEQASAQTIEITDIDIEEKIDESTGSTVYKVQIKVNPIF